MVEAQEERRMHDKERNHMNRLPGYDHATGRSELAMFASLGLVAVGLIGFAVFHAGRFAEDRDCIVSALSGEPAEPLQAAVVSNTNHAVTNFTASRGWSLHSQLRLTPVTLTPSRRR